MMQTDMQTGGPTDRKEGRQADGRADGHADRWAFGHAGGWASRYTDVQMPHSASDVLWLLAGMLEVLRQIAGRMVVGPMCNTMDGYDLY